MNLKKGAIFFLAFYAISTVLFSETQPFSPTLSLDQNTIFVRHIPGYESLLSQENSAWLGQELKPQMFIQTRDSLAGYTRINSTWVFPIKKIGLSVSYHRFSVQGIQRVERVLNGKGHQTGTFAHQFNAYTLGLGYALTDALSLGGTVVQESEQLLDYKNSKSRADVSLLFHKGKTWAGVQSKNFWTPSDDKRGVFAHAGIRLSIIESQLMSDLDHHRFSQNFHVHKHLDLSYDVLSDSKNVQRVGYGVVLNFNVVALNYVHYQFLNDFQGYSDIDQDSLAVLFRFK